MIYVMTLTDLQKRIAEVLGVSSSEKELAFNIFISKVAENLESDLTLKVPRIGFFQLKENDSNVKETLIYTPFSEELGKNSRTLYLTIDIPYKIYRNEESDSDVFSISVGKPLLPLSSDLNPLTETETSYVILKRSIEERVSEIIAESDILPNFNIWDDYYESLHSNDKSNESQTKLSELTSDIEFKEDLIAENITNNLLNTEISEDIIPHEESQNIISPTDLLEDYQFPDQKITIEEPSADETTEEITIDLTKKSESDKSKTTDELKNLLDEYEKEKISELDYSNIKSTLKDTEEEHTDLGSDDYIYDEELEVDEKEKDYLGLKKTVEENIEWNWGDELKEELGSAFEEERKPLFDFEDEEFEEESLDSDEIFKSTKPVKSHLFEQLEDSIKKELSQTKRTDFIEYTPQPKYEFVEDTRPIPPQQSHHYTNVPRSTEEQYYDELSEERDKYFSKNFLLIFVAFIIIVSIVIYMLMPNKNENVNSPLQTDLKKDSNTTEQLEASLPKDTTTTIPVDENDFPRVPSIPVADKDFKPNTTPKEKNKNETVKTRTKETSSLYNTPTSDTRVGKTIFYDGTNYNVQVSSWKNKEKAEQEVMRLRSLGLNAFIFEAYLPQKGGTWYRVRVGNFKTKEEAEFFQSKNSLQ